MKKELNFAKLLREQSTVKNSEACGRTDTCSLFVNNTLTDSSFYI